MPAGADPETRGPAEGKGSDFPERSVEWPPASPRAASQRTLAVGAERLDSVQPWVAGPRVGATWSRKTVTAQFIAVYSARHTSFI